MTWFEYWSREFGIPRYEYMVMTEGEIEDLAACRAIDSGAYREVISSKGNIFEGTMFPRLR